MAADGDSLQGADGEPTSSPAKAAKHHRPQREASKEVRYDDDFADDEVLDAEDSKEEECKQCSITNAAHVTTSHQGAAKAIVPSRTTTPPPVLWTVPTAKAAFPYDDPVPLRSATPPPEDFEAFFGNVRDDKPDTQFWGAQFWGVPFESTQINRPCDFRTITF